MSATQIPSELLALQRLYHWERSAPERVVLTQPMGGGVVRDFTWRQLMDQTRRMDSIVTTSARLRSTTLPFVEMVKSFLSSSLGGSFLINPVYTAPSVRPTVK